MKLIAGTGSLNKSSQSRESIYQKAWKLVDVSNKTATSP
jgi:molybdenum-dependent DNA-binding transcriptional regulator ModE